MVFSTPNKHKTRTSIKFNLFPEAQHVTKFSVFTLQCTKVGENCGSKMMHVVMKSKVINVSETKIGKIFGEINPEAQRKRQNVADRSLNPKIYNAKYFGQKIYYNQNEKLGMFRVPHVRA